MTLLDGKALAATILDEVKRVLASCRRTLTLAVVLVGEDLASKKFVAMKERMAHELGIQFRLYEYPTEISTNELRRNIADIVHGVKPDGMIIQLPLPAHINRQYILNSVPAELDIDVLSAKAVGNFSVGTSSIVPPVVGAVRALFGAYHINYRSKKITIVGAGELVGKPVATWLLSEKVSFNILEEGSAGAIETLRTADIIISGAGKPGLITGDMLNEGVVIIDAGTSESGGKLVGDVAFDSVAPKASFITPVPGGVGPLTVALIFQNLIRLSIR